MFEIVIPGTEMFDSELEEFFTIDDIVLKLEHSLVSLSKWESIHEKPFLSKEEKTEEEILSYVECMVLDGNPPEGWIERLQESNLETIRVHIEAKQTATWFSDTNSAPSREIITAEIIYYWMISMQVPMECENWHLNRLFTLLRVISNKNSPAKKMSRSEIAARNRELNAQRRAQLGTKG